MYLWIDIETIPSDTKPDLETIPVPGNYTKAETIQKFREDNQDKFWREQALHSLQGKICCIGWAVGNSPAVCRGVWEKSELAILQELNAVAQDIASSQGNVMWAGFNLKSFDLNWIWHRSVKHNLVALRDYIQRDRYPRNVLDVRDIWTGGDAYGKGKLKDIARFFGFDTIEGVDGSEVFDLFQSGDFAKISEYCRRDVEMTREIAWRMGRGNQPSIAKTSDPFGKEAA